MAHLGRSGTLNISLVHEFSMYIPGLECQRNLDAQTRRRVQASLEAAVHGARIVRSSSSRRPDSAARQPAGQKSNTLTYAASIADGRSGLVETVDFSQGSLFFKAGGDSPLDGVTYRPGKERIGAKAPVVPSAVSTAKVKACITTAIHALCDLFFTWRRWWLTATRVQKISLLAV